MDRKEALGIIGLLGKYFRDDKRLFHPEVRELYISALRKMDKQDAMTAVNNIVTDERRKDFCPGIDEIISAHKKITQEKQREVGNDEFCYVCNDEGGIIYFSDEYSQGLFLYCEFCRKGKKNKYSGNYYTPGISEYYDVDELKKQNIFKAAPKPTKGIIEAIQQIKIGEQI